MRQSCLLADVVIQPQFSAVCSTDLLQPVYGGHQLSCMISTALNWAWILYWI